MRFSGLDIFTNHPHHSRSMVRQINRNANSNPRRRGRGGV
jgi:hypothetical protein